MDQPTVLAETLDGDEPTLIPAPASVAATVVPARSGPTAGGRTTQARTTVLPSFTGAALELRERDRYQIVRVLGQGGMGEVSLAQDHDINRSVAVKYLHAELAEPGMVARFVEEIRTVGHLEHPNIVPIHDVGLDERGRYFFVMKHVEGETLEAIIDRLRARDPGYEARFDFERRAEIVLGVLHALEFAHERGIIHRDIKPANIMVGKHGEVVLMDWGIAKMAGRPEAAPMPASAPTERLVQTQLGSLLGTPLYMSPEQADGRVDSMDARSDLYSVAVVLHELMSLEHYLEGREELEPILEGVRTLLPRKGFTRYTRFTPPPAIFLHICLKGMQKDPGQRFQSAGEMVDRLRRELAGEGEIHCRMTAMRRGAGWFARLVDRRPMQSMVVGIAATVFVMATTAISISTMMHWFGH